MDSKVTDKAPTLPDEPVLYDLETGLTAGYKYVTKQDYDALRQSLLAERGRAERAVAEIADTVRKLRIVSPFKHNRISVEENGFNEGIHAAVKAIDAAIKGAQHE